ncbi:MAG TPA: DUF1549 domain-containing protein [Methylomirabilota bacterium]|nr:DUF1549 domain-containing protein [Methylomirabilota bacterium]
MLRSLVLVLAVLLQGLAAAGAEKSAPTEWSFRNHVQPVLAKNGCSAGACHGAAAGQGGFRLSLRGYDDDGDLIALTRHAAGRRVNLHEPGASLLLLKATGAVPHKGGKRFDTNSLDYKILSEWIASGAPGPKATDPRIEKIEIAEARSELGLGEEKQLTVRATFSDGRQEDVTRWAKYTSANESVAQISENGKVKVVASGEGAVTAWYLSRIAIATVSSPYTNKVDPAVFANLRSRNFIDDEVHTKLKALNLPPSPRASDSVFIRRAFLDTIGVLPTADEVRAFLADSSESKRDELIERLLQRPEFVDYWTYKWSDLLLVSSKKLKPQSMWAYYNWIRDNVAANTPWDEFAKSLVTASGSTLENGAANYYTLREDPRDVAEMTSQAFLGMSINCAKCHNHPMEKWTNDQYYKMANLFSRVRIKNGGTDDERIIFAAARGDLVQPLRGKPQAPAPLDGEELSLEDPADRRARMAEWLVSPKNPYFTRAVVNRVWANFMGVGLVEAVDDLRVTNPSSNEALFNAATEFLVQNKYDLKALMRAILQSETYQRSSQALPENAADDRFYARYYPRRLMAETLLDAVSQATGAPTQFAGYPEGWRAMQLPDASIDSYFLKTFGRPERTVVCECERTEEPNVTQVLHLANGDTVNKKLGAKGNRIDKLLAANMAPETLLEELFLNSLARTPTESEKSKLLAALAEAKPEEKRPLVEDVLWAALSSKEFIFNH